VATHRAVAPSVDIDLGPIVRHCLQARRIALIRDSVLTAVLVLGLVLATAPTIAVLVISFALGMIRGPSWQRRSAGAKIGIAAGAVAALLVVAGLIGLIVVVNGLRSLATTGSAAGSVGAAGAVGATFLIELVLILIVVGTTVAVYTSVKYRTLSEQLRPDAGPFKFGQANPDVEARIEQIEAAQWGNVTLYSGENPFIGTGRINRAWSVAIELDRARPAAQEMSAQPPSRRYVPIDPVELQQFIRERLLKLNDPALPANERVSALTVEDHVVGEGLRSWDGPLIDPAQKVPYSLAKPEAIDALIRHPQAGMRYYQRLSVSDRGQAVHSGGQEVIAGVDQEVAISAFVYVAVEGRMLYLQFVTTVLPPIHREYHIIDRLPKTSSRTFMTKVFLETANDVRQSGWRPVHAVPHAAADQARATGIRCGGFVVRRLSVRRRGRTAKRAADWRRSQATHPYPGSRRAQIHTHHRADADRHSLRLPARQGSGHERLCAGRRQHRQQLIRDQLRHRERAGDVQQRRHGHPDGAARAGAATRRKPMTEPPQPPDARSDGSASVVNYGTVTGPVAAGVQSHISQVSQVTGGQDTLAQIEAALRQLAADATSQLDATSAAEISDDAGRLAGEARHPRPDRDRIAQLLGRITTAASSAAALLEVIDRVRGLFEALLH
jgi:hypothetical protein